MILKKSIVIPKTCVCCYKYTSYSKQLQDPYDVLQLKKGCSIDSVKSKYRELSKIYHPDLNKDPQSEDIFKNINVAYMQIKEQYDLNPSGFAAKQNIRTEEDLDKLKFDYLNLTEDQIYKIIFGRSYQDDPMLYYRKECSHLRKKFEKERKKMYEAQGIEIKENKDIRDFQNLMYEEQRKEKQQYKQSAQSGPVLNSKEKSWMGILGLIVGGGGIYVSQKKEDGFAGTLDDQKLQQWRQKALANPKPRLPIKPKPKRREKTLEEKMKDGDYQLNCKSVWYKQAKIVEALNQRNDSRNRARFFNRNQGYHDIGDQGELYKVQTPH